MLTLNPIGNILGGGGAEGDLCDHFCIEIIGFSNPILKMCLFSFISANFQTIFFFDIGVDNHILSHYTREMASEHCVQESGKGGVPFLAQVPYERGVYIILATLKLF